MQAGVPHADSPPPAARGPGRARCSDQVYADTSQRGTGQVPPLSGLGFLIYKMRGCTFLYNQHTDLREEKIVILGWQIQHHFYYVYIAVSSRFYEISIYLIYIVIRKE